MRRLILSVLAVSALATLIGTPGIQAQKGKPAPTPNWSVQLPSDGTAANIFGPAEGLTNGGSVVVLAEYHPPQTDSKNMGWCYDCTLLKVQVNAPWSGSGPFLGFSGVAVATDPNNAAPYEYPGDLLEPGCVYPSFDGNGLINFTQPAAPGTGCALRFLSNKHPQGPYDRASVFITLPKVNMLTMPVGATATTLGTLAPQVLRLGSGACDEPHGDQVYFVSGAPNAAPPLVAGEGMSVYRADQNRWEVTLSRSAVVSNAHFYQYVQSLGKRTTTSCAVGSTVIDFTRPLSTTMTWTLK